MGLPPPVFFLPQSSSSPSPVPPPVLFLLQSCFSSSPVSPPVLFLPQSCSFPVLLISSPVPLSALVLSIPAVMLWVELKVERKQIHLISKMFQRLTNKISNQK